MPETTPDPTAAATGPALSPDALAALAAELDATPGLWPGHRGAVLSILGSGRPVGWIAGVAGTGVTTAAAAAARWWARYLGPVLGVAPTAHLACTLAEDTGARYVSATDFYADAAPLAPDTLLLVHDVDLLDAVRPGMGEVCAERAAQADGTLVWVGTSTATPPPGPGTARPGPNEAR